MWALGCLALLLGFGLLAVLGEFGQRAPSPKASPVAAPTSEPADTRTILYAQSDVVNVRSAPQKDAPIVRKLTLAERVVTISRDGEWLRLSGSDEQWVHSSVVGPHRPETPAEKEQRLAAEKQRAADARLAAKLGREIYAKTVREQFLDNGLDIKVRISGAQSDRLTYEFVLFNDVWAHRFQKDGLIKQAAELGFKRIDMKDGYDWHVYWDL